MLARIAAVRDQIRPSERKLADYAMAHPGDVINLSMAELADRVGVSEPTVARFCAALGCRGFREFKIKLAQDIAEQMQLLGSREGMGGGAEEGGAPQRAPAQRPAAGRPAPAPKSSTGFEDMDDDIPF